MNNALNISDIEAWRARAGMSKKALAAALGVNYDFFIRVLNGKAALSSGLVARFQAFASSAQSPLPPPSGGVSARDSLYSDVVVVPVRFTAEEWQEIAATLPDGADVEQILREFVKQLPLPPQE